MGTHASVRTYVHVDVCVGEYTHICSLYAHICVGMCVLVCMCVSLCVWVSPCVFVCMCVCACVCVVGVKAGQAGAEGSSAGAS